MRTKYKLNSDVADILIIYKYYNTIKFQYLDADFPSVFYLMESYSSLINKILAILQPIYAM